jgi:hypothetical protein
MSRAGPNPEETLQTVFTALDSHAEEIRLVTLHVGYFDIDPIVCTLSHARIGAAPKYEALSWA